MDNNNEDMLISPENIQNTLNTDSNLLNGSMNQIDEIETLTAEIPVQNPTISSNVINDVNNTINQSSNVINNNSINSETSNIEKVDVSQISGEDNLNLNVDSNNILTQSVGNRANGSNMGLDVDNNREEKFSVSMNDLNRNQAEENIVPNYYQEGQVNINNSKSKDIHMNGLLGAIILLTLATLHYFLIAPYLEKILIEQSFYEALNGISAYLFGGNVTSYDIKIYAYTFAFLTYTMLSLELLVYFTINLVKKGDLICDFKKHISTMIILSSIISIIVIVLFVNTDIDLFTPILRIITLDGHQLRFAFPEFAI